MNQIAFAEVINSLNICRWVQRFLVQATYWHDPLNEEEYKKYSTFLADINNERTLNVDYIQNLRSLEKFVFVRFDNDSMVQPVESEWFGFYKTGQSTEVESLQESSIYLEVRRFVYFPLFPLTWLFSLNLLM